MTGERYGPRSPDDVARLVAEHPLAWVVSAGAAGPHASLLPLLPRLSEAGEVVELAGHFARANPHVEALRPDGRVLILFLGPHGYVSPSWLADRAQAPTWNYASAWFEADVTFCESAEAISALLGELVAAMEEGRAGAWSIIDMGPRYEALQRRVIGFRAVVRRVHPRFKLGQDESGQVFADSLTGLDRQGEGGLALWMRRFDRG